MPDIYARDQDWDKHYQVPKGDEFCKAPQTTHHLRL